MKLKTAAYMVFVMLMLPAVAQTQQFIKHPRVAELEDQISRNATDYLRNRFPDRPFLVTVGVDAVRRNEGLQGSSGRNPERLPYMQLDSEEIQDEWDDPRMSLNELLLRTRKIQVNLTVPSSVLDAEMEELTTALYLVLHLTKGRDEVRVERRAWKEPTPWWAYALLAFGLVLMMLSGSYAINRVAVKRISGALSESRNSGGGAHSSAASTEMKDSGDSQQQDVRFNDPIKIRELIGGFAAQIAAFKTFPGRQDMFDLDSHGRKDSAGLGAVVSLFPEELQRKLFAFSYHPAWLQALHQPGTAGFECVELLQRIIRNQQAVTDKAWEELVILVWRLEEGIPKFVKQLEQDEAFAILSAMPKTISVRAARQAFPGSWGAILDPGFRPRAISAERNKAIASKAVEARALNDFSIIERYKHEKELLEYLKVVELNEEREIYEASSPDSMIHKLRPPFFGVLDQPDEAIKELVPRFSPEQWALALFNVARPERRKIEQYLSEKQMFLIRERWRRFDLAPPDRSMIGVARERVALVAREIALSMAQKTPDPAAAGAAVAEADRPENTGGGGADKKAS